MSTSAPSSLKCDSGGGGVVGANATTLGMSDGDIAFSIYRVDPFIRWPSHWMRISGPRVAVLFVLLGFIDVVALAPYLGDYSVDVRGDWVGLSITFVIRPVVWGIYGWMPFAIANVFSQLQTNGVVKGQDERYEELVRSSCRQLGGTWLTVVAVAFGVGSQFVVAIFFAPEGIPPWGEGYDLRFWLFAAPVGAATWYAIVKVLVRAALFSIVLGKLFGPSSSITLTIPTPHPDGAGGLGSLGRYAIGMSLLAAAALGFLSMAAIRNVFGVELTEDGLHPIHFVLSLVLVYPLLFWLYLFAPLWLVHEAMLKKRNEDLLELANNMGRHLSEIKGISSAPDDLAPRLERFRQLEEAYALILRTAPQWPFSRTTLSYLGAINFLALTSTILGIALTVQRVFRI